jgi:hypothetical protein
LPQADGTPELDLDLSMIAHPPTPISGRTVQALQSPRPSTPLTRRPESHSSPSPHPASSVLSPVSTRSSQPIVQQRHLAPSSHGTEEDGSGDNDSDDDSSDEPSPRRTRSSKARGKMPESNHLDDDNSGAGEDEIIDEAAFVEVDVVPKPKKGRARTKGHKSGGSDTKDVSKPAKRTEKSEQVIRTLIGEVSWDLNGLCSDTDYAPNFEGDYKNQCQQSSCPTSKSFIPSITVLLTLSGGQLSERCFKLDLFDGDHTHEAISHEFFAVESNVRDFFRVHFRLSSLSVRRLSNMGFSKISRRW